MKTSRRAVSLPFVTAIRVSAGIVGGAVLLAASAIGAASLLMAKRVVTPSKREPDARIEGFDLKAQTITLSRTPDTELPGRYGLHVSGTPDYLKLGAVLSATDTSVTRKLLTQVETTSRIDRDATFSGWYFDTPDDLRLDYTPELIGTAVGPSPAWLFPGGDTWVVVVHGRGTTRAETLRAVPVFHALGYTTLVVSYRNDGEAPRSVGGTYGLGSTEWRDVEEALGYARRNGAQRLLLMGWSMGGAIVMQTVLQSSHAALIDGIILDSPVVNWREVLAHQAELNRVPAAIGSLAVAALENPVVAKVAGSEAKIPFDDMNMLARADALRVPTLILHSDDDGFVPSDASRALAAARPDIVTLESFTVARHTKLWNYDEMRWTNAITAWARSREQSRPSLVVPELTVDDEADRVPAEESD
ncbi:alpha/beta hydrolase family protein [Microbacterium sp. YY-03]|uniref:alpha/beta hydrolase family protein n=1 Tax=Microbacterium sp. YY-03 TaxID=3421636 RepID=UPI003D17DA28